MAFAIRSSLRVALPAPRHLSSGHLRIALRVLTGGFSAVAAGFIAVLAALLAGGWLFAAVLAARSDMRTGIAFAAPSHRLSLLGHSMGPTTIPPAALAHLPARAAAGGPAPSVIDPVGGLALVMPGASRKLARPSVSEDITGSLGTPDPRLATLNAAAVRRPGHSSNDESPTPLPRTRPRLAALGPVDDLGLKQRDDAYPAKTAIYDITAKTVYLPSGERLEAHSGLGPLMDDPRRVDQKNRGATPPNTYHLKMRESLFHGVQAIRLTPAADAQMYGRDGILAHSYLLGPSGQSNGCISFRDYGRFLRAYQRGEIDRIVVVARLSELPRFAARPDARTAANGLVSRSH